MWPHLHKRAHFWRINASMLPDKKTFCQLLSAFGIVFVRTQTEMLRKHQFLYSCFGLLMELSLLQLLVSFCKKIVNKQRLQTKYLLPCRMCHFQTVQFGVWFEFCWIWFHNFDRGLGHDWKFLLHLCSQVSHNVEFWRVSCQSDFTWNH